VIDASIGLALIHLPIPHPPAIYYRHQAELTAKRGLGYLDSVGLVDRTVGDVRRTLEQASQRTLPPVSLRNIDSPRSLCPVRSTVNPAVQISKPILQPGLILFPRHAVHSRCSLSLQSEKTVSK